MNGRVGCITGDSLWLQSEAGAAEVSRLLRFNDCLWMMSTNTLSACVRVFVLNVSLLTEANSSVSVAYR